jgi:hypothetical protein
LPEPSDRWKRLGQEFLIVLMSPPVVARFIACKQLIIMEILVEATGVGLFGVLTAS